MACRTVTVSPAARASVTAENTALAIEHGCEWVTLVRGFAIYPGLRCLNLLDG